MKPRTSKILALTLVAIGVLGLAFLFIPRTETLPGPGEIVIYKSPSCSCCEQYIPYLAEHGMTARVEEREDLSGIERQLHVPLSMESCHTLVVDGYFVEGHVPIEAIQKLRAEKPNIAGIALPGMPAGSPGMGGVKSAPFVIYAVGHDGKTTEFMII